MEEKALDIISRAAQVFMKYGIKSVNMDDIAKNLGISKKTLYKYVKDKEDLVRKAMNLHCDLEDEAIEKICAAGYNAIEETFEMTRFIHGMLKNVHPSIMFDMEKYHPAVMRDMMENRNEQIMNCITGNLEKGIKEGLYREDLSPEIISRAYIAMVNALMKGESFPVNGNISIAQVYLEIVRYHIRGIASKKGLDYLSKRVKKEQERIDLTTSLTDL